MILYLTTVHPPPPRKTIFFFLAVKTIFLTHLITRLVHIILVFPVFFSVFLFLLDFFGQLDSFPYFRFGGRGGGDVFQ
jgi:hypothetical protein